MEAAFAHILHTISIILGVAFLIALTVFLLIWRNFGTGVISPKRRKNSESKFKAGNLRPLMKNTLEDFRYCVLTKDDDIDHDDADGGGNGEEPTQQQNWA